jgi:hypothetical protein
MVDTGNTCLWFHHDFRVRRRSAYMLAGT